MPTCPGNAISAITARSATVENDVVEVPQWHVAGDWFDVCNCNISCPCTFAQPPSSGDCQGVLAWHIREGHYGDVPLDGLNVMALAAFEGNIWAGETKAIMGVFLDERADERQREALLMIFGGDAGGFPAVFAELIGEMRGIEFVPIEFEVASDLRHWRAEVPGPVILTFAAANRKRREQERPFVPTGIFLLGYLVVWGGFSAVVTVLQWRLHEIALLTPMMASASPLLSGATLMAAGIFQLTPLKHICLQHCRSPLGFLLTNWRDDFRGVFRMGYSTGPTAWAAAGC